MKAQAAVGCLLCNLVAASATVNEPLLKPRRFWSLPTGAVTPSGWLLDQLHLQAQGLSGHLSHFWADIAESIWIGGSADGGLHERTPYWLNGVVPLSFLLQNADRSIRPATGIWVKTNVTTCLNGTDMRNYDLRDFNVDNREECESRCLADPQCQAWVVDECSSDYSSPHCWLKSTDKGAYQSGQSCRCLGLVGEHKPKPVDVPAQVQHYINYILAHADQTSGWLGPPIGDPTSDGDQYWGPSNVLQALYQYAEGRTETGMPPNVTKTAARAVALHLLEQKKRMKTAKLSSWAFARWIDMALTAEWLLDNKEMASLSEDEGTQLFELVGELHDQGADWDGWFQTFSGNAGGHNVNNAQGLKSSAVYYRFNGNQTMHDLALGRMKNLDDRYGLPTGMFNGDEILPNPATRHPSRGIELCGVVEAMFSYSVMASTFGDVALFDRVERIAYNALPATWASPRGGDMWAHQYLQAVNELNALRAGDHIWTHDGPDAEAYGLEPNYGCCTANFNQGWPKLAHAAVLLTQDKTGVVVGLYAPLSAKSTSNGLTVVIDTQYPFGDEAHVSVANAGEKSAPVLLRIPSWATSATVNGNKAPAGNFWQGEVGAGVTETFVVAFNPQIRTEEWDNGAVSIHRGALMYSLPISANYTTYGHHYGIDMSNDYELAPTSEWRYALDIKALEFHNVGLAPQDAPFNHTGWPSYIIADARVVTSGWNIVKNSADVPPTSPCASGAKSTCSTSTTKIKLVPHGGTDLRIGEFPVA